MTYIDENNTKTPYQTNSQSGVTLMEMIAALAIIAVIIVGSLALYKAATSSQSSTQLVQDVMAVRSAVRQLYLGQGSYGSGELATVLVASKRLPSTIKNSGSPPILTHQSGKTITLTGAGATFTIGIDDLTPDVCIPLLTSLGDWSSATVNTTAVTLPVTASAAATACGTGDSDIVFTSN